MHNERIQGANDASPHIPMRRLAAEGLEQHRAGNLAAAETAYRAILARDPKHADALHLLGLIEGRRDPEAGIRLIERAIARTWKVSAYHNNLGNLLLRVENTARAEASYRQALRLDPANSDAMLNLGKLLQTAGDLEGARRYIASALRVAPGTVEAHLSLARVEQAARAYAAAAACCRKATAIAPGHAPAYLLLAAAQAAAGDPDPAETSLRRAVAVDGSFADAHFNLGNLLRAGGRLSEAAASYRRAIELAPQAADAWNNLGVTLAELGQTDEALGAWIKASELNPDDAELLFNMGKEAARRGDVQVARQRLEEALDLEPNHARARLELGNLERGEGRLAEAAEHYRGAMATTPLSAEACNNLGATLLDLAAASAADGAEAGDERLAEAEGALDRAVELNPAYADAWFNLGKLAVLQEQPARAVELLGRALALDPSQARAHQELGVARERLGELEAAVACYERSLSLDPGCTAVRRNLAALRALLGEERGLVELESMVREEPASAQAHWACSMALLLHGHYREGWQEYEWRLQADPRRASPRTFLTPRWRGEPLQGRSILVHAEQGLGDTIQFARYAALVAERGGSVVLEVQPALQRLLATLPGVAQCLPQGAAAPDNCAFHVPLLSLPMVLGVDAPSPPVRSPGWPESARGSLEREPRPELTARPLEVGLAWAGAPGHRRDRLRSIPLGRFSSLATIEGVRFTSLQRGLAAEQGRGSFPFSGDCSGATDMLDTAAVIAGLDLVITVDTSMAHLAGTLGAPTWVLLDRTQDWRWGLRSRQTPWYPLAELFRQAGSGTPDWRPVLDEVAQRLSALAGGN